MKNRSIYFLSSFVIFTILLGCIKTNNLEEVTINFPVITVTESLKTDFPSKTQELTGTLIPTESKTPIVFSSPTKSLPTWTPFPTIPTEENQEYVSGLLEDNGGCKLPCLWGIMPGETTWRETRQFFDSFARTSSLDQYGYGYVEPPFESEYINRLSFHFKVEDRLVVGISTYNWYFPQIQAWYYLPRVLQKHGEPDQVSIYTDGKNRAGSRPTGLILFYEDYGSMIEYVSFSEIRAKGEEIVICPEGTYNIMYLWTQGERITYEEAVERFVENVEQGLPMPRPLQEVSDMDPQTFYEVFKDPDNKPCLTTYLEYWPNFNK